MYACQEVNKIMKIIANNFKSNELIKIIREYSGLTQEAFGKKIKRSRNAIQFYEYGQRNYDTELLLEIAKQFDLEIIIQSKNKH